MSGVKMDNINKKLIKKYITRITGKSLNGDTEFYINYPEWDCDEENKDDFNIEDSEYFKYIKYSSEEELIKNFRELIKKTNFLKNNQPNSKLIKEIKSIMQAISNPNNLYKRLGVDIIRINIGKDLINYADPEEDTSTLLPKIIYLRKNLTDKYGYIIPNVRIMDSETLKDTEYEIFVREKSVLKETINFDDITPEQATTHIVNNLEKICFQHVKQIFTKADTLKLMELVISYNPTLVNDLIPLLISAIDLKYIFTNLLSKKISIKDIIYIFELLNFHAQHTQDIEELTQLLENDLNF